MKVYIVVVVVDVLVYCILKKAKNYAIATAYKGSLYWLLIG